MRLMSNDGAAGGLKAGWVISILLGPYLIRTPSSLAQGRIPAPSVAARIRRRVAADTTRAPFRGIWRVCMRARALHPGGSPSRRRLRSRGEDAGATAGEDPRHR